MSEDRTSGIPQPEEAAAPLQTNVQENKGAPPPNKLNEPEQTVTRDTSPNVTPSSPEPTSHEAKTISSILEILYLALPITIYLLLINTLIGWQDMESILYFIALPVSLGLGKVAANHFQQLLARNNFRIFLIVFSLIGIILILIRLSGFNFIILLSECSDGPFLKITTKEIPVYKTPSENAEVIVKLTIDQEVDIIANSNKSDDLWYEVQLPGGNIGWVFFQRRYMEAHCTAIHSPDIITFSAMVTETSTPTPTSTTNLSPTDTIISTLSPTDPPTVTPSMTSTPTPNLAPSNTSTSISTQPLLPTATATIPYLTLASGQKIDQNVITNSNYKAYQEVTHSQVSSPLPNDSNPYSSSTGREAEAYCLTRGSRIPTPDEWEAAIQIVGFQYYEDQSEWAVSGNQFYLVRIQDDIPVRLPSTPENIFRGKVVFRCIY
ncbi:MAG: hypothetical protein K8L97_31010 [Anaerolineae bacterium]|nr:hypothetical protein [Anaerolineae bacterium]